MNPTNTGLLLGLGAALAWTGANLTIRPAAERMGSFGSLLLAQATGVIPIIGLAYLTEGSPGSLSGTDSWLLLGVAGLASCLAFGGLFNAFRLGSVSVVGPLISGWSVISVGVGFVFMGQTPSTWAIAGVVCVGLGNGVLARFSMEDGTSRKGVSSIAILAALISALGFGIMIPAMNVVAKETGQLWAIPAVWGVQWLIGIPILLVLGQMGTAPKNAGDWKAALVPGLFEAAGFASLAVGLGLAPLAVVAPTSSLSTGFTVLAGFFLLGERLPKAAAIGAGVVAIGVVLVGIN